MNWQPIETAPKNVRILLYYPRNSFVVTGGWCEDKYVDFPSPYWANDNNNCARHQRENKPSHWMPIPAPPAEGDEIYKRTLELFKIFEKGLEEARLNFEHQTGGEYDHRDLWSVRVKFLENFKQAWHRFIDRPVP